MGISCSISCLTPEHETELRAMRESCASDDEFSDLLERQVVEHQRAMAQVSWLQKLLFPKKYASDRPWLFNSLRDSERRAKAGEIGGFGKDWHRIQVCLEIMARDDAAAAGALKLFTSCDDESSYLLESEDTVSWIIPHEIAAEIAAAAERVDFSRMETLAAGGALTFPDDYPPGRPNELDLAMLGVYWKDGRHVLSTAAAREQSVWVTIS